MKSIEIPINKILGSYRKTPSVFTSKNAAAGDISNDRIKTCNIYKDNGWTHEARVFASRSDARLHAKTAGATCDCAQGGGNRGVVVFDAEYHQNGCRFRKRITHNGHESLLIIEANYKACSIINSTFLSLGNDDGYSLGVDL